MTQRKVLSIRRKLNVKQRKENKYAFNFRIDLLIDLGLVDCYTHATRSYLFEASVSVIIVR